MEDSLSIIEEEMEQLEVSTGEMTNMMMTVSELDQGIGHYCDLDNCQPKSQGFREMDLTSVKMATEMLVKMMWSEDSNTNDDGDDDYDEIPR